MPKKAETTSQKIDSIERRLRKTEVHARAVQARMRTLLLKDCVISQISWHLNNMPPVGVMDAGDLPAACLWAMDQPDEWWKGGSQYNMADWVKKILEGYRTRPTQNPTAPDSTREYQMIMAMIAQAELEIRKGSEEVERDARRWVTSNDAHPLSFRWCYDMTGKDYQVMRRALLQGERAEEAA